jgi:teichuronic acid exporter
MIGKSVLNSLKWNTLSRAFSSLISLAILLFTSFKFGIEEVGLFGILMVIGKFVEVSTDFGFSQYGIVWLSSTDRKLNYLKINILLKTLIKQKLIFCLLIIPIYFIVITLVFKISIILVLFSLLYFLLLGVETSIGGIFEYLKKFSIISISWFISSIIIILAFSVDLFFHYIDSISVIFIILSFAILLQVIFLIFSIILYQLKIKTTDNFDTILSSPDLKAPFSYFLFYLLGVSYTNIDKLVLMTFADLNLIGLYYFASRIANFYEMIGSLLSRSLFPFMCESFHRSYQILKKNYLKAFGALTLIGLLLIVTYAYFVNSIFQEYIDSVLIFSILIFAYTFRNISYLYGSLMSSQPKLQKVKIKSNILVMITGLILMIILTKILNIQGAAISTLLVNILLLYIYIEEVKKYDRSLTNSF